jgi:hypothetical protein
VSATGFTPIFNIWDSKIPLWTAEDPDTFGMGLTFSVDEGLGYQDWIDTMSTDLGYLSNPT